LPFGRIFDPERPRHTRHAPQAVPNAHRQGAPHNALHLAPTRCPSASPSTARRRPHLTMWLPNAPVSLPNDPATHATPPKQCSTPAAGALPTTPSTSHPLAAPLLPRHNQNGDVAQVTLITPSRTLEVISAEPRDPRQPQPEQRRKQRACMSQRRCSPVWASQRRKRHGN
jgi:hypothetical protein